MERVTRESCVMVVRLVSIVRAVDDSAEWDGSSIAESPVHTCQALHLLVLSFHFACIKNESCTLADQATCRLPLSR